MQRDAIDLQHWEEREDLRFRIISEKNPQTTIQRRTKYGCCQAEGIQSRWQHRSSQQVPLCWSQVLEQSESGRYQWYLVRRRIKDDFPRTPKQTNRHSMGTQRWSNRSQLVRTSTPPGTDQPVHRSKYPWNRAIRSTSILERYYIPLVMHYRHFHAEHLWVNTAADPPLAAHIYGQRPYHTPR